MWNWIQAAAGAAEGKPSTTAPSSRQRSATPSASPDRRRRIATERSSNSGAAVPRRSVSPAARSTVSANSGQRQHQGDRRSISGGAMAHGAGWHHHPHLTSTTSTAVVPAANVSVGAVSSITADDNDEAIEYSHQQDGDGAKRPASKRSTSPSASFKRTPLRSRPAATTAAIGGGGGGASSPQHNASPLRSGFSKQRSSNSTTAADTKSVAPPPSYSDGKGSSQQRSVSPSVSSWSTSVKQQTKGSYRRHGSTERQRRAVSPSPTTATTVGGGTAADTRSIYGGESLAGHRLGATHGGRGRDEGRRRNGRSVSPDASAIVAGRRVNRRTDVNIPTSYSASPSRLALQAAGRQQAGEEGHGDRKSLAGQAPAAASSRSPAPFVAAQHELDQSTTRMLFTPTTSGGRGANHNPQLQTSELDVGDAASTPALAPTGRHPALIDDFADDHNNNVAAVGGAAVQRSGSNSWVRALPMSVHPDGTATVNVLPPPMSEEMPPEHYFDPNNDNDLVDPPAGLVNGGGGSERYLLPLSKHRRREGKAAIISKRVVDGDERRKQAAEQEEVTHRGVSSTAWPNHPPPASYVYLDPEQLRAIMVEQWQQLQASHGVVGNHYPRHPDQSGSVYDYGFLSARSNAPVSGDRQKRHDEDVRDEPQVENVANAGPSATVDEEKQATASNDATSQRAPSQDSRSRTPVPPIVGMHRAGSGSPTRANFTRSQSVASSIPAQANPLAGFFSPNNVSCNTHDTEASPPPPPDSEDDEPPAFLGDTVSPQRAPAIQERGGSPIPSPTMETPSFVSTPVAATSGSRGGQETPYSMPNSTGMLSPTRPPLQRPLANPTSPSSSTHGTQTPSLMHLNSTPSGNRSLSAASVSTLGSRSRGRESGSGINLQQIKDWVAQDAERVARLERELAKARQTADEINSGSPVPPESRLMRSPIP